MSGIEPKGDGEEVHVVRTERVCEGVVVKHMSNGWKHIAENENTQTRVVRVPPTFTGALVEELER